MQPALLNAHQHTLDPRWRTRTARLSSHRARNEASVMRELANLFHDAGAVCDDVFASRLPLATVLYFALEPGRGFFHAS